MIINGENINIDIFDADSAGAYERAQRKIEKLSELMTTELPLDEKIKKACKVICTEINNLFGKGTADRLVDNKNNLRECAAVWRAITAGVTDQVTAEAKAAFEE